MQGIVLPSEERPIQMFPMDFEEFLWATGNDMLMDFIRKKYAEKKPMEQAFHRQAMDAFRLYMIVGGMPQAVKNYTLSSLTKCMKKFGEYMTTPTVLHAADFKVEDGITYLPLYMTPLL